MGYQGSPGTFNIHGTIPTASEHHRGSRHLPSHGFSSLDSASPQITTELHAMTGNRHERVNGPTKGPRKLCLPEQTGNADANITPEFFNPYNHIVVPAPMPVTDTVHSLLQTQPNARFQRPAGPGYSYSRAPKTRFGNQQSDPVRRKQIQTNYLDSMAARIPLFGSFDDRSMDKERLQALLTRIARESLEQHGKDYDYPISENDIDLRCFGSSRNGFSLPGADLDLLFTMHMGPNPAELETECPSILQDAFQAAGFQSMLIQKARIPILKIRGITSQLLDSVQMGYQREGPNPEASATASQTTCQEVYPSDEDTASPTVDMQCDINFSGHLALYNTELLRCYALSDERVRIVGIFVKMWAKARDINTPYHGTLCSYGYILMVIHYLMNIAYPPVVPNLQLMYQLAQPEDTTSVNEEGLGFFSNEAKLKSKAWTRPEHVNYQSIGELLRGFFAYYGSRGTYSPRGGFDWVKDVISIRTPGGILSKEAKDWTAAQTDENGHRLRFLLRVEDPFEHHHNVGRTVTYSGVKKIRTEFQRAQRIINRVQDIPGVGWEWREDNGQVGEDLLANFQKKSLDAQRPPRKEKDDASQRDLVSEPMINPPVGDSNKSSARAMSVDH
ncbi:hypothetical protein BDV59DRAFT_186914 [Aspergillus ambiguus]|uniref:uncharacterized protein n=1 Tax=Aspergillus ambiguus TaxID=176160 RepID=UPI003CCD294E